MQSLGMLAAAAMLPSCDYGDSQLGKYYRDAVKMRTEDTAFTPEMYFPLLKHFENKKNNPETTIDNIKDLLPFFNAIYFEVTGKKIHKKLSHAFYPQSETMNACDYDSGCEGHYDEYYKTVFQEKRPVDIDFLGNAYHELGHAHDHLMWGKKISEFTPEFMVLVGMALAEKYRPPQAIKSNLTLKESKQDFGEFTEKEFAPLIHKGRYHFVMEAWNGYRGLNQLSEEHAALYENYKEVLLADMNRVIQVGEAGSFEEAMKWMSVLKPSELYEIAAAEREPKEFYELVDKTIDVVEQTVLSGPHGDKIVPVVSDNEEVLEEILYVTEMVKHLRKMNQGYRIKAES